MPRAAVAIDGSTKYLVSLVRIAALLLRLGFHAGISSITKISLRALIYACTVRTSKVLFSLLDKSELIEDNGADVPMCRANDRNNLATLSGFFIEPSTLFTSE